MEEKKEERKEYNIYQIVCNETGEVYIGKTTRTLNDRLSGHKQLDCSSKQIIERNNYYMEQIISTFDKDESIYLEGFYIRNTDNCINEVIPDRSEKEWREENRDILLEKNKEWRKKNKNYIYEKNKIWRLEHKNEINERAKLKYTCECGSILRKDGKAKHEKTLIHQNFINSK